MSNIRYRFSSLFLTLLLCTFFLQSHEGVADIVTLEDGASFRCIVLDEVESSDSGDQYVKIRVMNSIIWIPRDEINRIEKTEDEKRASSEVQALIDRLIQEGKIVPELEKQLDFIVPQTPVQSNVTITAKKIMGWAYLYENNRAMEEGERAQLVEGGVVPEDYLLVVSPNSRVTLDVGGIGEIGLYGQTHIRFDDLRVDSSIQKYTIGLRLLEGEAWFSFKKKENGDNDWKRVIFSINAVKTVIQDGTLYARTTETFAAVDITFIEGERNLYFQRGADGPYLISPGQMMEVSPGSNTIPVKAAENHQKLSQTIQTWNNWEPEKLAVDLEIHIPPLKTLTPYPPIPILYDPEIQIDSSLLMPPITQSLSEVLDEYRQALDQYQYDTGKYPPNEYGLFGLQKSYNVGSWRGPYIPLDLPRKDPWGNAFVYELFENNGKKYPDVRSMGPNKKDDRGLGDDIR